MPPAPWRIIRGDALTVLPTLPAASVDAVITDPPYNSGGRTSSDRRNQSALTKYVSPQSRHAPDAHALGDFAGDNRDQRSYTAWLSMLLAESLRVARIGASCLVFSDWRQLAATSDALQAGGWTWRGIIPWHKPISRPIANGFRQECEYVLWGSNGDPTKHPETIYLPGWLEGSQPRGKSRVHITQKPLDVMRALVRICPPGGHVLDPCAGSGTTGVAALAEGRTWTGIEITEHYANVARGRFDLGA
ncbi:DNA-methyltransferase [Embleya sp. NPDC127516]|uniref:DNA-methyltransferase n=1 Tax=Embleya sp. NPDC127516 TaxID=3363990 RepID=UPI0038029D22